MSWMHYAHKFTHWTVLHAGHLVVSQQLNLIVLSDVLNRIAVLAVSLSLKYWSFIHSHLTSLFSLANSGSELCSVSV
jgi:hypothetical protein